MTDSKQFLYDAFLSYAPEDEQVAGFSGFTAREGSLAASPMMLFPEASRLIWMLSYDPNATRAPGRVLTGGLAGGLVGDFPLQVRRGGPGAGEEEGKPGNEEAHPSQSDRSPQPFSVTTRNATSGEPSGSRCSRSGSAEICVQPEGNGASKLAEA